MDMMGSVEDISATKLKELDFWRKKLKGFQEIGKKTVTFDRRTLSDMLLACMSNDELWNTLDDILIGLKVRMNERKSIKKFHDDTLDTLKKFWRCLICPFAIWTFHAVRVFTRASEIF